MTQPAREDIFNALFALVSSGEGQGGVVQWADGGAFVFTSRRVKDFSDLTGQQPALCQAEHSESINQTTKLPYTRTFKVKWVIYHQAGANSGSVPSTTNNNILDALEAAIAPPPYQQDECQTLGGLVYHCFVDGEVFRDPGDLDGQALMIVPITILAP